MELASASRRAALLAAALLLAACQPTAAESPPRPEYDVDYIVGFAPADGEAAVRIVATPRTGRLIALTLAMPADRYRAIDGDGQVERRGDKVVWLPEPGKPSTLTYRYRVDSPRASGRYDARITRDWAIVRGEDLVPTLTVRTTKGADSSARLRFELPEGWENAESPYVLGGGGRGFVVVNPSRNFDRPVGWMMAGDITTRRDEAGDTRIAVTGPKNEGVRRNDVLAFVNILLPEYRRAFGDLPSKLLVITAGDPMWRGGLSGPRSLFLHADRPLISENGTSTLAHELVHVFTRLRGADGDDWIAEGLAEYYSIELMRRAGLVSDARAEQSLDWMREHGAGVASLTSDASSRERTARAVALFAALDAEIRERTGGDQDLDDVVRELAELREVSRADLRHEVERLTGETSDVLAGAMREGAGG